MRNLRTYSFLSLLLVIELLISIFGSTNYGYFYAILILLLLVFSYLLDKKSVKFEKLLLSQHKYEKLEYVDGLKISNFITICLFLCSLLVISVILLMYNLLITTSLVSYLTLLTIFVYALVYTLIIKKYILIHKKLNLYVHSKKTQKSLASVMNLTLISFKKVKSG